MYVLEFTDDGFFEGKLPSRKDLYDIRPYENTYLLKLHTNFEVRSPLQCVAEIKKDDYC